MTDRAVLEPTAGLAARAANRLRSRADRVVGMRPTAGHSLSFQLAWLANPDVLKAIDADLRPTVQRGEPAIYLFKASDASAYGLLKQAFEQRPRTDPTSGRKLEYSRLMASPSPDALYVGSGRDLRTRIGQHLGRIGGPGTFSMRLSLWATNVAASIDLTYWTYELGMDGIELEALEQELWDEFRPLFGKRSGK